MLAMLLVAVAAAPAGVPGAGLAPGLAQAVEAAPRTASPPLDPLSADPLDRAALLALPSVYRLESVFALDALRLRDGTRLALPEGARRLREVGTAFAVAPGGVLVAAAHVADPGGERVAATAYQALSAHGGTPIELEEARAWVARTGARPVDLRIERSVRQADAGAGARASLAFSPRRLATDPSADLTVLRIGAPAAPSLPLTGSSSIDTPVVTIGFGREPAFDAPPRGELAPAVRPGALGRSGGVESLPHTTLVEVTTGVRQGDSGGPVVDAEGAVRGLVLFQSEQGGLAIRAGEIQSLLREEGILAGAGITTVRFRAAMSRFWDLDLAAAAAGLDATLTAFPAHTLAGPLAQRARELDAAGFALEGHRRPQGFLLALGVLSALGALACALALALGAGARTRRGVPVRMR